MNRERYSAIAHSTLGYCNPIDAAVMRRAIEIIDPPVGGSAVDMGCGKGELLIDLARLRRMRGVGIERSALMHAEALARCEAAGVGGMVDVRLGDAVEAEKEMRTGSFDLAACVGSSHALRGPESALRILRTLVRPGGSVIWGEGYWKRRPGPEYLAKLGGSEEELTTHAGNVALAAGLGYTPLAAFTASEREWDEYEWTYARNIERYVREHPGDPDGAAMLARCREWRDLVLAHGRETMGFGLYVLQREG